MEVFVKSVNHPMYMLSSEGRVFSRKRWRFLSSISSNRDFIQVSMDGKNVMLHREMAESFSGMAISKVWFVDENKLNCKLSNLRWALVDARPQTLRVITKYEFANGMFHELSVTYRKEVGNPNLKEELCSSRTQFGK